ncbi:MAG: bifunctional methylenetetrahydrofolate dehydrogenase/methenyltetrahydrofolate cyclohydrolase FolD [Pseudomonadota bacterium]|nr:bifunctional methylenetetrahydrofolate dehydrogenase/methenyltetrahydrofolate cyclohydrolase FolD [Pseudomonadota bacterium]
MSKARLIDGKKLAAKLRKTVGTQTLTLKKAYGLVPGLAAVLVGEDPASQIYIRNKETHAREVGMNNFSRRLSKNISEAKLLKIVSELNADPVINGILVQQPLSKKIDAFTVIEKMDPAKDVDGFHSFNLSALFRGSGGLVPCTPKGCMMLLETTISDLNGANAVVLGRSNIVGKPLAQLLLAANTTVTITHSHTRNLPEICRNADILIAAIGQPKLIKGHWIKPGAVVLDVGINRIKTKDGKQTLVGDVDFDEVVEIAGAITPVPGGVGPMTIACLLENTLIACCRQNGVPVPEI